jgi:hypothetical protein
VASNLPPWTNRHDEDIQAFTVLGAIVKDDNLPTTENIPLPNAPPIWPGASNDVFPADGWGVQGTCPQKLDNHANRGPSISKPHDIWLSMTKLDNWLLFFHHVYCQSIMLPEMNKKLDPRHPPIEWWEYLCWFLGIWHLLTTTDGHDRQSFWLISNHDEPHFKGAPFRIKQSNI